MSNARPSSMGSVFSLYQWWTENDLALANLKAIKNKKIAILANESIMAKTYYIGRGIYNMAQFVYER